MLKIFITYFHKRREMKLWEKRSRGRSALLHPNGITTGSTQRPSVCFFLRKRYPMAATNWDLPQILRNRYAFYSRLSRDSENLKAGHFYSVVTSHRRIGSREAHTRLPYFASISYALSKGCNKIMKYVLCNGEYKIIIEFFTVC
jgi:hypothetical protein